MDRISECGLALAAAEHDGARLPAGQLAGCRAALAASFAQTASWLLGTSGPAPRPERPASDPPAALGPPVRPGTPVPPGAIPAEDSRTSQGPKDGDDPALSQVITETRHVLDALSAARAAMVPANSPDGLHPGGPDSGEPGSRGLVTGDAQ